MIPRHGHSTLWERHGGTVGGEVSLGGSFEYEFMDAGDVQQG